MYQMFGLVIQWPGPSCVADVVSNAKFVTSLIDCALMQLSLAGGPPQAVRAEPSSNVSTQTNNIFSELNFFIVKVLLKKIIIFVWNNFSEYPTLYEGKNLKNEHSRTSLHTPH